MKTNKIKKQRLPFCILSQEELNRKIKIYDGVATCPRCGRKHAIGYGKTDGQTNKLLGFVTCKGRTYLVTINDRQI